MKQSLQLRTSQHLTLTPQLQQSIRLLQLSTLELQQELEQIVRDNPLLERLDDPLATSTRLLADGSIAHGSAPDQQAERGDRESAGEESDSGADMARTHETADQGEGEAGDWSFDDAPRVNKAPEDDDARPQIEAPQESLSEHLQEQMRLSIRDQRRRALVEVLIDALDDNGYLQESLADILGWLPPELEVTMEELEAALADLQQFDPPGIGARNISECLAIQIRLLPKVPFVTRKMALRIVEHHLSLFGQREFTKLKRVLDCDDEDLREAQDVIRQCNPHPGAAFATDTATAVIPDVIVKRHKNGWQVTLNSDVMPRLQINQMYASILKNTRGEAALASELQEAKWLIRNVKQRFDTILRVSQAIVERQKNFFSHGAVAMRPLVLREIADTLGLHESTISRVTTQKFMMTPHGIFELKYFFGSHIATEAGGEASSTAIRELIKQLIGAEDRKNPLSDSKIAGMLGEQGMVIARRTVAKYREALKIPPANLRKSL